MIAHLVYFKANPGQQDNLTKALAHFCREIKQAVPGVLDINWGVNFNTNPRSAEFTHALYSRLDTRESLNAYQVHPIHLDLVRQLNESLSDLRVPLDYEITAV